MPKSSRLLMLCSLLFCLSACETVGSVAQGIADRAKSSSQAAPDAKPTDVPISRSPVPSPTAGAIGQPTSVAKAQPAAAAQPAADRAGPEVIQAAGYDWLVVSKSEGGIKIQTKGLPKDQDALDVASGHCRKSGRVAQLARPRRMVLMTWNFFEFNCAR